MESMENKKDIEISSKINTEMRKIKPLFKNLSKERKRLVDRQLEQLAFLQVTLDRLVYEINNSDILENFSQGTQKFKRENPALRSYNATIKSYTALSKQLCELLPNDEKQKAGETLMQFITSPTLTRK
jgi:hypothetical protein